MENVDPEELLRRYQPAAPPFGLRLRIVASVGPGRTWPWVAAAAVLLASVLSLTALTGERVARASDWQARDASGRDVDNLAQWLGGDAAARRLAELIVAEQTWRAFNAEDAHGSTISEEPASAFH